MNALAGPLKKSREYWGERPCLEHEVMRELNERLRPRWDGLGTRLRPAVYPSGWKWWLSGGGVRRTWTDK
jgi:hypothetical protein